MNRARAALTLFVTLSVIQGSWPGRALAQSAEAIRANERGIADLKQHVLGSGAGKPVPWSVMREWVKARTRADGWPNQRLFGQGSAFTELGARALWYENAQQQLDALRTAIEVKLPAANAISYTRLLDSQNAAFMQLQGELEENARVRVPSALKAIRTSSAAVRVSASRTLLSQTFTTEGLSKAKDASTQLQRLLDPRELSPEILAAAKAKAVDILATLSPSTQSSLKQLPEGIDKYRQIAAEGLSNANDASVQLQALLEPRPLSSEALATAKTKTEIILATLTTDATKVLRDLPESVDKYRQIAAVGAGLADTLSSQGQKNPIALDRALILAKSFGQFDKAQLDLVSNFKVQSQVVQESLLRDLDSAQKAWPRLLNDALAVQVEPGKAVPEEIKLVASFTEQFSQLKDVLQGRVQGLGSPAAVAMLNFGIAQTHLASPALVQGLAAFANTKGNYASAALGLASSLGVNPPPEIQRVLPLLATAASFMSGAGALSAISGLAGGGGILSFAGGFGGSAKDYGADFAKIEAELAQINERLSAIENKLDRLEQEIRANHEEVMSALEAINWAVSRTYTLLLSQYHIDRLGSCKVAANRSEAEDPMEQVTECNKQLDLLLTAEDTPTLFTLEMNLLNRNLKDNAQDASVREKGARAFLSRLARGKDCNALFSPSATMDDLAVKLYNPSTTPTECDVIMTKRKLLEPGIVSTYVTTEQDAMQASYKSPAASLWWSQHGDSIRKRWVHELDLLDDATAQQTIMVGDVVLPEIVKTIETHADLTGLKQIWGVNTPSILAENVVRCWMWQKVSKDAAARTLYGFTWHADDVRFWYALTGSTPEEMTFSHDLVKKALINGKSQEERLWFVTFNGLPNVKVPLPTPKEWMHFELRWTNALTEAVSTRRRLIDELSGMDYLTNLRKSGNLADLLQIFALAEPSQ